MTSVFNLSTYLLLVEINKKCFLFKGYLRYRTLSSESVPSEAQVNNFFISQKSHVPFLRYSIFQICNYIMNFQIYDVSMSIDT